MAVRDIQQKLLLHLLAQFLPAFCMTGVAKSVCLARKHKVPLKLTNRGSAISFRKIEKKGLTKSF